MENNNTNQYGQTVKLNQLGELVDLCAAIDSPLLIVSEPGFGKTETIRRLKGYEKVFISAGTSEVEDIKGLVFNDGKTIKYWTPDWYQELVDAKKPTICFIDELSAGNHTVRNALLTLLDGSRRIPHLPKVSDKVVFVAAMNPPETNINCVELALPTLNRFIIVNLDQSFQTYSELIRSNYDMKVAKLKKKPGEHTSDVLNSVLPSLWGQEANHQLLSPRTMGRLVTTANLFGCAVAERYSMAIVGTPISIKIGAKSDSLIEAAVLMAIESGDLTPIKKVIKEGGIIVKALEKIKGSDRHKLANLIAKTSDGELASELIELVDKAWNK